MSTNGEDEEQEFALRDASWYDRPNVRSVKQYHAAIGWGDDLVAACNRNLPLDEGSATTVEEVALTHCCARRACLNRYLEASASGRTGDQARDSGDDDVTRERAGQ